MGAHKDPVSLRRIRDMRRKCGSLTTASESFLIHSIARARSRLDGAMAEVGCYEGGTARMICEGKRSRAQHLFDTFDGLPELHGDERHTHAKGQYAASMEKVRELLSPFPDVHRYKRVFP